MKQPTWAVARQFFISLLALQWSKVSVVQAHLQSPDEMIVTVGLFVTGSAFPLWASAHLAQMASWRKYLQCRSVQHVNQESAHLGAFGASNLRCFFRGHWLLRMIGTAWISWCCSFNTRGKPPAFNSKWRRDSRVWMELPHVPSPKKVIVYKGKTTITCFTWWIYACPFTTNQSARGNRVRRRKQFPER